MKTARLVAVAFAFCALTTLPFSTAIVSAQAETETATDWSEMNGTWKATEGTMAGQKFPAGQLDSIRLKINNGSFDFAGSGIEQSGKLEMVAATDDKPATLDVIVEEGPNEGNTVQAICKMEEGKLIVCYAMTGDRPKDFTSTAENNTLLLTYETVEE